MLAGSLDCFRWGGGGGCITARGVCLCVVRLARRLYDSTPYGILGLWITVFGEVSKHQKRACWGWGGCVRCLCQCSVGAFPVFLLFLLFVAGLEELLLGLIPAESGQTVSGLVSSSHPAALVRFTTPKMISADFLAGCRVSTEYYVCVSKESLHFEDKNTI